MPPAGGEGLSLHAGKNIFWLSVDEPFAGLHVQRLTQLYSHESVQLPTGEVFASALCVASVPPPIHRKIDSVSCNVAPMSIDLLHSVRVRGALRSLGAAYNGCLRVLFAWLLP